MLNGIVEGSGEGTGLVLLHPVGLDRTFWGPLPSNVGQGRPVLSLDLRGHGASALGDPRAPIETYAEDVFAAIRHHGMEKPVVLGLSFGGMVAQTLALEHPEAVSRLILCGCPGGIPEEARRTLRERGLAAEKGGMAAIIPATLERWFTAGFLGHPAVERVHTRLATDDAQAWSDAWHAISNFFALPRLGAVTVPTLVVSGEVDKATSTQASSALAAAIPGAELVVLKDAPHMMQLETPQPFVDAIRRFLSN